MKKTFAIALTMILVISLCGFFAFSSSPEIYHGESDGFICGNILVDEAYFPDAANDVQTPNKFFANANANSAWLFYDYLTTAQKTIYNAIVQAEAGLNIGADTSTEAVIGITVPARQISGNSADALKAALQNTVIGAMSAVIEDYPQYFWLSGYKISYGYSYDSAGNYWITSMDLYITLETNDYQNFATVRSCYSQMMTAVNNFTVSGSSRYAKCKSIHDKICEMTVYTMNVPMAHQPTGVFISGQAVCEGYAEAFKLICDREGIPCILVVGTGNGGAHKWNYVKMEDGKWYGMDATWADQGNSGTFYDYFIVGSESLSSSAFGTQTKFGNGKETSASHINTGALFSYSGFALTYPTISQTAYSSVLVSPSASATFDNQKGMLFFSKDADIRSSILCIASPSYAPSNNKATVSGTTTGGTLTITSPVSTQYTLVRWGDVNADGKTDFTDNALIEEAAIQEAEFTNEACFNAADYNQDGVIDVFDMFYADRYVNTGTLLNG